MNIDSFFSHHGVTENPFAAEEARHDPVFQRLADVHTNHPDFEKILGRIDQPSTSIVFGEKGSGKTAIRLQIGKCIAEHNAQATDRRTLLVAYDDLNPALDRVVRHRCRRRPFDKRDIEKVLRDFRLEDHQDAILSLAVTALIDALLGEPDPRGGPKRREPLTKRLRKAPRGLRADAAVLAALYDQPAGRSAMRRFRRLRSRLRLGWRLPVVLMLWLRIALVITAIGLTTAHLALQPTRPWVEPAMRAAVVLAVALVAMRLWRITRTWWLSRRVRRDTPTVNRSLGELRQKLIEMRRGDLAHQVWPTASGGTDSRYELTCRLVDVLGAVGYAGMIVLIDRVDEPTLVNGQAGRMRSVIWPMLDNKFLQQEGVGLKLLLPIELRHAVYRESEVFFQEARLDKQNLIDRLTWSGATLYDLCTDRLRTCRPSSENSICLTDLFEPDVTRQMLIDALDQMQQPRDAFKFIYAVIHEHCRMVPQEQAVCRIPRLTLEAVRRQQTRRVQELHRGLAPA